MIFPLFPLFSSFFRDTIMNTKTTKRFHIAVIGGDGIGPEVTDQAVKVLKAIGQRFTHTFDFVPCQMGAVAIDATGIPLPLATLEVVHRTDAVLLGAIGDPKYDHNPNAPVRPEQGLLQLRKELGLFSNIRPIHTYSSLFHLSPLKSHLLEGVDILMFRELTGGAYFGKKSRSADGLSATDECVYSREEIERIAHPAFRAAQQRKKKLTLVDKANVLETSRLWRSVVREIAERYTEVKVEYLYVDNAAMQLVLNPKQFDVILTENMFGDILSDEASVLSGSLGLLPSASIGATTAMFEPIHGSYPQAAGKDIANPVGSILSAMMLLEYLELHEEAELVRQAVQWTLANGFVSKDLNPANYYATSVIGDVIADIIANRVPNAQFQDKHQAVLSSSQMENIAIGKSTII